MTVCVASLYLNNCILGASDRMLTSGNIEFQPGQSKIFAVTNSIVIMTAGDIAVHAELLAEVKSFVKTRLAADSKTWISVKSIAELYASSYSSLRLRNAERELLTPVGLTCESYLSRQSHLNKDFVENLRSQLQRYRFPGVAAIVTGVDETGAHLFVVQNDVVENRDTIGFAAVGIGQGHSDTQFMAAGHTRSSSAARALLITHRAKKKAEIAPGVGTVTDMFTMGPIPGSYTPLNPSVVEDLDGLYADYMSKIAEVDSNAEKDCKDYLDRAQVKNNQAAPAAAPENTASAPKK